jgi:hypothetical protein
MFRSPLMTVPASGTALYTVDMATMAGNGEPFFRNPTVVVSVEGSTTVKATSSHHTVDGFKVTLRNENPGTQVVRFNAVAWDAYAGDLGA